MQVLGLHLFGVIPIVALSKFHPGLLVRFVTSGGNQGIIVDCHLRDCGREMLQHDLLCGHSCDKISEVIFEVVLVDEFFDCGAFWGHSLL